MNAVPVASLYLALHAVLVIVLSARVSGRRRGRAIGIGTGDDIEMERAVRAQANAVEYIPLALLLLLAAELNGTATALLHGFGAALLVGRLLHAAGLSGNAGYSFGRFWGTVITWLVILSLAAVNLLSLF